MSSLRSLPLLAALSLPNLAFADTPQVVVDILPIHSLVASVMEGVGDPALLLPAGADPHAYALRPSDARALSEASLLVWIGPELTPWLGDTLPRLAPQAKSLALLHAPGTDVLDARRDALFAGDTDDDHGHQENGDDHAHDHAEEDPHAWLDPENARSWLAAIAEELATIDPANAARYRQNAAAAQQKVLALETEIAQTLPRGDDNRRTALFVVHDSYQYFEHRFDVAIAGAISASDASVPGAARLGQLQTSVSGYGRICVLAEPQYSDRLVHATIGDDVKIQVTDPIGAHLSPGPSQYEAILKEIATAIADCHR